MSPYGNVYWLVWVSSRSNGDCARGSSVLRAPPISKGDYPHSSPLCTLPRPQTSRTHCLDVPLWKRVLACVGEFA